MTGTGLRRARPRRLVILAAAVGVAVVSAREVPPAPTPTFYEPLWVPLVSVEVEAGGAGPGTSG